MSQNIFEFLIANIDHLAGRLATPQHEHKIHFLDNQGASRTCCGRSRSTWCGWGLPWCPCTSRSWSCPPWPSGRPPPRGWSWWGWTASPGSAWCDTAVDSDVGTTTFARGTCWSIWEHREEWKCSLSWIGNPLHKSIPPFDLDYGMRIGFRLPLFHTMWILLGCFEMFLSLHWGHQGQVHMLPTHSESALQKKIV